MSSDRRPTDLVGKVALVTGAGVRVGRAIAVALGKSGAHVAVHYHQSARDAAQTCALVQDAGGEATLVNADLSIRGEASQLVDRVLQTCGGLDVLVPSAANFERIPLDSVDEHAWDRAVQLNASAPFFLAHSARNALREARGAIVFVTCASTSTPFKDHLPYVVSKGALRHVMRALALELAPEVRVNAVAPGTVVPPARMSDEAVQALASGVPLQSIGSAEDIADAVLYLATAPFVTGQELFVDGGRELAGVERFA